MKRIYIVILLIIFFVNGCAVFDIFKSKHDWRTQQKPSLENIDNWVQYYGPYYNQSTLDELCKYDLRVIGYMDDRHVVPYDACGEGIDLQYIAACEASEAHRRYHGWLQNLDPRFRLLNNSDYSGTWIVDFRKQAWQDRLINQGIPWTLDHGGHGVLLDTFGDIDLFLGNGWDFVQAGIDIVRKIRQKYPQIIIAINEPPMSMIDSIAGYVDIVILEQLMFDIRSGDQFGRIRNGWGNNKFKQLIKKRNSLPANKKFKLFSIDMVDQQSKAELSIDSAKAYNILPTITPSSSLQKRYNKIPNNYLKVIKNN